METKRKEIGLRDGGRFGVIKDLGHSLRMSRFNVKAIPEFSGPEYRVSEEYRNHLVEIENQKARARAESQRYWNTR